MLAVLRRDAYTGGIWLAAIKAAGAFAALEGDGTFRNECEAMLKKAQASFEQKLWTGSYYRLWNDTPQNRRCDTCLAAQLTGQWFAYSCGLGEVLPRRHVFAALEHVHRVNAAGQVWALVNGITPDGSRDKTDKPHGHSDTATLGETWCYAATCVYAGRPDLGLPAAARLAENISLRQRSPWNTYWNLDPDTGQMRWGAEVLQQYVRVGPLGRLDGTPPAGAVARQQATRHSARRVRPARSGRPLPQG